MTESRQPLSTSMKLDICVKVQVVSKYLMIAVKVSGFGKTEPGT